MPDSYSCTPLSVPLAILKLLKAESELQNSWSVFSTYSIDKFNSLPQGQWESGCI